ncbi:MAG: hypothetical protein IKJ11_01985 [Clostridia bacterium]|nr:hypothetical protein [Clostridia bacterium]
MMKKFVEYEKLSKKQKREIDKAKRATWGCVSPVTKRIESAKLYNRKKHQRGNRDSGAGVFVLMGI